MTIYKSSQMHPPRNWAFIAIVAITLPFTGCTLLPTVIWIINPNDVDAEYDGLAGGKRVAVVCRPDNKIAFQNMEVANELAFRVGKELDTNVPKIDVVHQGEINDWIDQSELESYAEMGAAMNADYVVAIELKDFSIHKGKTMLQGQSSVEIKIFDVTQGRIDEQLVPIDSLYPPRSGIPVDMTDTRFENKFRRKFVSVVAHQIARRFYDHDSRTAVGIDRFYTEE